jgi:hypothetical protein
MTEPIETIIGNGFSSVFGSNDIIGLIFLAFFGAFVMLQDTRFDVKVLIMIPALLLAMVFISWLSIAVVIALGFLVYLAARKAGLF